MFCFTSLVVSILSFALTLGPSITNVLIIIRPSICSWASVCRREINVTRPKRVSWSCFVSDIESKLNLDRLKYGSHRRLVHNIEFFTAPVSLNGRSHSFLVSSLSLYVSVFVWHFIHNFTVHLSIYIFNQDALSIILNHDSATITKQSSVIFVYFF